MKIALMKTVQMKNALLKTALLKIALHRRRLAVISKKISISRVNIITNFEDIWCPMLK